MAQYVRVRLQSRSTLSATPILKVSWGKATGKAGHQTDQWLVDITQYSQHAFGLADLHATENRQNAA